MPETRHVSVNDGDVLLLVGTMKGAFLFKSNGARARWDMAGPYFPGHPIYSLHLDQRKGRRRLFAAGGMEHWRPAFHHSDDVGRTWTNPEQIPIRFPEGVDATVKRIWQIQPGIDPDTLYCGVEPAALFESRDAGASWSLVRGLWDHPQRARWEPGGGGLCLHTILPDPRDAKRITIAVSTGGVYRTDDGGRTWSAKNQGVRAEFRPDKYPEFGQCVHKIVHHPSRPERMFLQNHWGLYRSDDAGDSWRDVAKGVPSDFGFCMAMHPHDADTVFILPIESDQFRCTPEGKLRVYRTRDGGGSWEPLTRGLPQKNALECVLRDAMDVDVLNPAGVYFGTRSGTVWGSSSGGAAWAEVMSGLPPVLCVRAEVIGDTSRARISKPAAKPSTAMQRIAPRKTAAKKSRAATAKRRPAARKPADRAARKKK
jgi:photosystem II stability/assembly factor-like uncharacterized protein